MSLARDLRRATDRRQVAATALARVWRTAASARHDKLDRFAKLLNSLGYRQVLARGFALVRDASGQPIRSARGVAAGAALDIEFADGHIAVSVGDGSAPSRPRRLKTKAVQGSLF